jgi:chemotaxis protein MotB
MQKWILPAMVLGAAWAALSTTGCASYDEYLKEQNARRKAEAALLESQAKLGDAEARVRALEAQLAELGDESKDAIIASLRKELLAKDGRIAELAGMVDRLAKRPMLKPYALPPELNAALQAFAKAHPDIVEFDAERGVVKWKSDLLFELGSDVVRDQFAASVREFADIINSPAAAEFGVVIVGHTDTTPIRKADTMAKHPTNWHLSVHRAYSVARIFLDAGVAPERIGLMGFGEYQPIAPNDTAENKAKNRRVETYLVPAAAMGAFIG